MNDTEFTTIFKTEINNINALITEGKLRTARKQLDSIWDTAIERTQEKENVFESYKIMINALKDLLVLYQTFGKEPVKVGYHNILGFQEEVAEKYFTKAKIANGKKKALEAEIYAERALFCYQDTIACLLRSNHKELSDSFTKLSGFVNTCNQIYIMLFRLGLNNSKLEKLERPLTGILNMFSMIFKKLRIRIEALEKTGQKTNTAVSELSEFVMKAIRIRQLISEIRADLEPHDVRNECLTNFDEKLHILLGAHLVSVKPSARTEGGGQTESLDNTKRPLSESDKERNESNDDDDQDEVVFAKKKNLKRRKFVIEDDEVDEEVVVVATTDARASDRKEALDTDAGEVQVLLKEKVLGRDMPVGNVSSVPALVLEPTPSQLPEIASLPSPMQASTSLSSPGPVMASSSSMQASLPLPTPAPEPTIAPVPLSSLLPTPTLTMLYTSAPLPLPTLTSLSSSVPVAPVTATVVAPIAQATQEIPTSTIRYAHRPVRSSVMPSPATTPASSSSKPARPAPLTIIPGPAARSHSSLSSLSSSSSSSSKPRKKLPVGKKDWARTCLSIIELKALEEHEARAIFEASEAGNSYGKLNLALCYFYNIIADGTHEIAEGLLNEAILLGNLDAYAILAKYYLNDLDEVCGTKCDTKQALYLYEQLAETHGRKEYYYKVGLLYLNGHKDLPKSEANALKYFILAANAGYKPAIESHAELRHHAEDVKIRDLELALALYKRLEALRYPGAKTKRERCEAEWNAVLSLSGWANDSTSSSSLSSLSSITSNRASGRKLRP